MVKMWKCLWGVKLPPFQQMQTMNVCMCSTRHSVRDGECTQKRNQAAFFCIHAEKGQWLNHADLWRGYRPSKTAISKVYIELPCHVNKRLPWENSFLEHTLTPITTRYTCKELSCQWNGVKLSLVVCPTWPFVCCRQILWLIVDD